MFKNTILLILIISTSTFLSISIKNDLTTPIKVQPIFNQNDCIRPLKSIAFHIWKEPSNRDYDGKIIFKILMSGKNSYLTEYILIGDLFKGQLSKKANLQEIPLYIQTRYRKVNCKTGE